jgi:hypothetical protein
LEATGPCAASWCTGSPYHEPGWHVGLDVDAGISSIQISWDLGQDELPDIFSPSGVHAEDQYRPNGRIDVWLTGEDFLRTKVLSCAISPLAGPIVIGFTAGTGGATCTAEIDNFLVEGA